jgi:nitrogen fixation protein NifU and related proteins
VSDALYHDAILALAKDRRHAGRLDAPTHSHTSDNPLCGDRVTIDIERAPDGTVRRIGHFVRGCVLCQASAAALAASVEGQGPAAFEAAEAALARVLAGENTSENGIWAAFSPVARHTSRLDCVRLPLVAAKPVFEA